MSDMPISSNISIPGIVNKTGIINSGSESVWMELMGDVYGIIDEKTELIESYVKSGDVKNYTTQVHALKTTCRMIGAVDLGEEFFTLEKLGKENNLEQIIKSTPDVLNTFRSLKPYLEPFFEKNDSPKSDYNRDEVASALDKLISSIDAFDLSTAEEAMKKLASYSYDESISSKMTNLEKLVSNLDYDEASELAQKLLSEI